MQHRHVYKQNGEESMYVTLCHNAFIQ